MAEAALDMNYASQLRSSQMQERYPTQNNPQPSGQVIEASERFISNRRRRQAGSIGQSPADVIPLVPAEVPKARDPVAELTFKQQMEQRRHMDKMRAQQFALPAELETVSDQFADEEMGQMRQWYGDELNRGGIGDMVKAQMDQKFAKPVRDIVNKRIEELKKKALEKVKAQAQEAFKKAFTKAFGSATQKTVWSAIDQGSILESEAAAFTSWFTPGTVLTSWQGGTGALNGGKKFIPEGTLIDWIEPPPLSTPSGKAPGNAAESATLLINLYDLFVWLLIPIYWMLLLFVAIAIHLLIAYHVLPFILIAAVITYAGSFVF